MRAFLARRRHRVTIALACMAVCTSCTRAIPAGARLEGDSITHLEARISRQGATGWVRFGDPAEIERFRGIMLKEAAAGAPAFGSPAQADAPTFWVRWSTGREATCEVGGDRKMRFWHLEIPLSDEEYQYLVSLAARAERLTPARP